MINEEYNVFELCKARLPSLLKDEQTGNSKYIFAVDQKSIAEALISWGYGVIYISSMQEQAEIIEILDGSFWSNNITIIGCCSTSINSAIDKAAKNKNFLNGWKILKNRKEFYALHTDELKPVVEMFINNIEMPCSLPIDESTGLIEAKKSLYRDVAAYVIQKYSIWEIDEEPRIKKKGRIFIPFTPDINDKILIKELNNSSKRYRNEVFYYVISLAPKARFTENAIPFLNGVYDLKEQKLKSYTDDMYFRNCIPHNYNENAILDSASAEIADKFFSAVSCDDYEIEKLLIDIIAYIFVEGNPWQKTFFIYGTGGNGKGTLFSLIECIFGKDKVEYKSWEELSTSTGRHNIIDKMVVLCNDINNNFVKEPQALKLLISCEPLTIKKLYQDELTAVFKGKVISSGNCIPRVNDTSNGWQRRQCIIPFEADFRNSPDVKMAEKITAEPVVEYIICNAMARLPKVLKDGFESPNRVQELTEEYRLNNNPVALFLKECGDKFKGIENGKVLEVIYTYYTNFCSENGYKTMSKNPFSKSAKSAGLKRTRKHGEPEIFFIE